MEKWKPWQWGVWRHRPDLIKGTQGEMRITPFCEFIPANGDDGEMVLSDTEYGTIAEFGDQVNILDSWGANGQESGIRISKEHADLIVKCVNEAMSG